MKCRAIRTNTDGKKLVVWFGVEKIFTQGFDDVKWDVATWDMDAVVTTFAKNKSSFDNDKAAVASSLTQRLSVIKRELWYLMSYGLPLFEKNKSKTEFDATILSIISQHPDVVNVTKFSSSLVNAKYSCNTEIETKYGQISIEI